MSRHTRGSRGKAPQEFTPGTDTDASMHHNPSIAWLNAPVGKIAFVHDPHLRVRVHDRQLPYPALCILVEHMRFDPGLIQEVSDQVCIGQARSRINLFQVGNGGRVELHLTARVARMLV